MWQSEGIKWNEFYIEPNRLVELSNQYIQLLDMQHDIENELNKWLDDYNRRKKLLLNTAHELINEVRSQKIWRAKTNSYINPLIKEAIEVNDHLRDDVEYTRRNMENLEEELQYIINEIQDILFC